MPSILSNNFLYQLLKKEIDFDSDTFKIAVMKSTFVFNRASHNAYSDISADELATAYGYTAGGATLSGIALTKDDVGNLAKAAWNSVTWSISGGNITTPGAIIYDDTTVTKYIVGYIDFGGLQTTVDGGVATIATPTVKLKG